MLSVTYTDGCKSRYTVTRIIKLYTYFCTPLHLCCYSEYFAVLLVGRFRDRFPVVSLGIFSVVPPTVPCALRSTQPLKVSTRDLSWGKGGRCVWLTTYHSCSAETSRKSGALIYPAPLGPPRPVVGDFYFTYSEYLPSAGDEGLKVPKEMQLQKT